MAEPFVHVNLSQSAPDFQRIAMGPGVAMLDRLNSNYDILRRWLMDFVAEPVTDEQGVGFLIPLRGGEADEGRSRQRPLAKCIPVTRRDLDKDLRKPLRELRALIAQIKPENATQRALHAALTESLKTQLSPDDPYPGCNLFKYQDEDRRWRLLWCWGYRRKGASPGLPIIRDRQLLFLSEQDGAGLASSRPRRFPKLIGAAVVLLLLAGAGYLGVQKGWLRLPVGGPGKAEPATTGPALVVSPKLWEGPTGGRITFVLTRRDASGKTADVLRQAATTVDDPRVLEIDPVTSVATAKAVGKTLVVFHVGGESVEATVSVLPPEPPSSLAVVPEKPDLAVGSTARLKLIGKYKDGREVDLTGQAEWDSTAKTTTFCYRGLIEGLVEGSGGVRARYRSDPKAAYQEATATFQVAGETFASLELGVEPRPIVVGKASDLRAFALTASGGRRDVLQSSLLTWVSEPPSLAIVDGLHLIADRPGKGRIKATFGKLSQTLDVDVVDAPANPAAQLVATPRKPSMVVGEALQLEVSPESDDAVDFVSKAPNLVEVDEDGRLRALAAGSAEVEVVRGGHKAVVSVTVAEGKFLSIAVLPERLQVTVEDVQPVRVAGRLADDRVVDLAAESLTWDVLPSSQQVDFDPKLMTVRGVAPTGDRPQILSVRLGELRASAQVQVVAAPFRLEITPDQPIVLPVGQAVTLQAWAVYGDNRRVEVTNPGLAWEAPEVKGLDRKGATIQAVAPRSGPMAIVATYQGQRSAEVVIQSTPAAPVSLTLKAPRPVLLVGEAGPLTLAADGDGGTVGLAAGGAKFAVDKPKILQVDPATGGYRALAPGEVEVKATHPASAEPATIKLWIIDPKQARLAFRPAELEVAVDRVAELFLEIVTKDGDAKEGSFALGAAPGRRMIWGRLDTVRWNDPKITGVKACEPFSVTGMYLGMTATARVTVVAAKTTDGQGAPIRVNPPSANLSAGKTVSPKVEQRAAGEKETWVEVRPDAVAWRTPEGVAWTPPSNSLRPTAGLVKAVAGPQELVAEFEGQKATLILTPDAAPPRPVAGPYRIRGEPGEGILRVGEERRLLVVGKGAEGQEETVPGVRWTPDFEDEFVIWKAPVLTAKKGGKNQKLTATAGDKTLTASIVTMEPSSLAAAPPSSRAASTGGGASRRGVTRSRGRNTGYGNWGPDYVGGSWAPGYGWPGYGPGYPWVGGYQPWINYYGGDPNLPLRVDGRTVRLRDLPPERLAKLDRNTPPEVARPDRIEITTVDGGAALSVPVEASSRDYRVLAYYAGVKEPRDVTKAASLHVAPTTLATVRSGRIVGLSVGSGIVEASYQGMTTDPDLRLDVTGDHKLDRIEVGPAATTLTIGEAVTLRATGFVGGHSIGDVTDWADLVWKSRTPNVLRADGPSVSALAPGRGGITAQLGPIISEPAEVTVVADATGLAGTPLKAPAQIDILVDQTLHLGDDVPVTRGEADVSASVGVTVAAPDLLGFNERSRTLTGRAPGRTDVVFTLGGSRVTMIVHVHAAPALSGATTVVVEPGTDTLAVGEDRQLRVYLVGKLGEKLDRTESALLSVASGDALTLTGATVTGLKAGAGEIQARLPGVAEPGRATFQVREEEISELTVSPNPMTLAVGARRRLQITGRGPARRIDLGAHPDLKVEVVGAPGTIEVVDGDEVVGLAPGGAAVRLSWRGRAEARVVVQVTGEALAGLRIEPKVATVAAGQSITFRVVGERGGALVPSGADDGVELAVSQASVALVDAGLTVRGVAPGTTEVFARLGTARAMARLSVTAAAEPEGAPPPKARAKALAFRPSSLTLTLGTAGQRVLVETMMDDGTSVDASQDALVTIDDPKLVEARKTPSGTLLKPLAVGQTQATASLGDMKTTQPVLIRIVEADRALARIQATPAPLLIRVGDATGFGKVEVAPAPGQPRVEVAYRVSSVDGGVAAVEGRDSLRGIKAGRGRATLKVVDPGGKYDGLEGTAPVEVVAADAPSGSAPATLTLSGPDRATVGQRVEFRVSRVVDGFERPVTNQGATLVVGQEQSALAEVAPGGILIARKAGRVTVQARHEGLVSAPKELTIEAVAAAFRKIEVVIRPEPLIVTERRPYSLKGHPADGGAAQDLTDAPDAARPRVELMADDPAVALVEAPFVVAKKEGKFRLRATLGEVQSDEVPLQVTAARESLRLRIEPSDVAIHLGETTPPFRVTGLSLRAAVARELIPDLTSEDEKVLAPDPAAKGRFIGRSLGKVKVRARVGDQDVSTEVTVLGNAFASVKPSETTNTHDQGKTFDVDVVVRATKPAAGGLEYRLVGEAGAKDVAWVAAKPDGDAMVVELRSPRLEVRPPDFLYQLLVEARAPGSQVVERYPFTFRVQGGLRLKIEPKAAPGG